MLVKISFYSNSIIRKGKSFHLTAVVKADLWWTKNRSINLRCYEFQVRTKQKTAINKKSLAIDQIAKKLDSQDKIALKKFENQDYLAIIVKIQVKFLINRWKLFPNLINC